MLKYVATAAAAALLLAVALRSGKAAGGPPAGPTHGTPDHVLVQRVGDSYSLVVAHRLAGTVSRAALVYEDGHGRARTAAEETDCQRSLASSGAGISGDGYATQVRLRARLPGDARSVRLVLEDETGTRVFPVALD